MSENILKINNLKKYFLVKKKILSKEASYIKAVNGVNITVKKGETFGIVGESGCGKSTTGRMILRLLEPTEGEIIYENRNVLDLSKKEMKKLRKEIQMIFQDPYSSLNPRLKVSEIIKEVLVLHKIEAKSNLNKKVIELLEAVGLGEQHMDRYPHEFSGGQRQRIGIARALAVDPKLIICDEPVSALDVSIQAQIVNLMKDLQKERELTYIFISHDLSVVHHLCDRIAVMYLGKIVEMGNKEDIFENPKHPYTKALLNAIPKIEDMQEEKLQLLTGDMPSPANPPKGCAFHTRCPFAMETCKTLEPVLDTLGNNHEVACHLFAEELTSKPV
ncbi:ABC transporter ATP-binding protein [Ornithinibacillus sp. 4-3]|uniref:ABC transporter ATP-binding protein n=1 Tax=Ornithinibacillus sp. 4-3 TaxID=3231488 RepID=A0AB39HPF9_9BACI